ncbi:MAG: hypothetical protein COT81_02335 [Candidatus Buchananbacteria bacterium CG10_big_fil_rev_8_21_14_0_10_42_9]|uniref:SHS2 domain-containing protein n=1 Tax=Candidatus Buchananbacteria bacterium CG10_big_fil_rev_8_21_14_0_10_42_9 TaxID=1974526 RepID=A0A2H0W1Q1_9BACT|nr:MAG: hypothetical protein COT81_02335 [Candidatus Buchananbacteria bacterium CG10_big_fil_rev_8_21_14_0_10_42_9]
MNLISIFTKSKTIAGLEVQDSCLRLGLLSINSKGEVKVINALKQSLPARVISHGQIVNGQNFNQQLNILLKKFKPKVEFVILTLSPEIIYSKKYTFPSSLNREKIENSMNTTLGFNLPRSINDVYLDWEKRYAGEDNDIFVASAPKKVINSYLNYLSLSKMQVVAIEFSSYSMARVLNVGSTTYYSLVIQQFPSGANFSITRNKLIVFNRFVPTDKRQIDANEISNEAVRIVNFFENDSQFKLDQDDIIKVEDVLIVGSDESLANLVKSKTNLPVYAGVLDPKYANHLPAGEPGEWMAVLGASLRGLVPRSKDEMISLMPVGTEKAFEYEKAYVFTSVMTNLLALISIFIMIASAAVWYFLYTNQQNLDSRHFTLVDPAREAKAELLIKRFTEFNDLLAQTNLILTSSPKWSDVLSTIISLTPDTVIVNKLDANSISSQFVMSGEAATRDDLNLLKDNLIASEHFTDVNLPTTNLELIEDIPFTIRFNLADPEKFKG